MMQGVIPDLEPIVINANSIYDVDTPFGINEVSELKLKEYSEIVASSIVKEFINENRSDSDANCCAENSINQNGETTFSCCNKENI